MRTDKLIGDDGGWTIDIYSDSGKRIRVEDYSASGELKLSVDYRYDAHGNNVERVVRNGSGGLLRRLEFDFDAQGKEIVHREYDASDNLVFTRRL